MRLDAKQRALIAAVELNAEAPMARIRRETKLRDHSIRYQLNQMEEKGLLRRRVFINVYPLGYQDYALYFSLSPHSVKAREKLMQFLIDSPEVSILSQHGGDYQYRLAICSYSLTKVVEFMDDLSSKFPNTFFEKSLSLRVSLSLFSRKYLNPKAKPRTVAFGDIGTRVYLTDRDHRILRTMEAIPAASTRALAREVGLPHTTVEYRIKHLEKNGIIAGHLYDVSAIELGYLRYRLLIYARGISSSFNKALYSYSAEHPHIVYFLRCLGSWDFELGIEVEEPGQVVNFTQDLLSTFPGDLNSVKVLPLFSHLKLKNYPFIERPRQPFEDDPDLG